jgi:hypothetical protein
MTNLINPKSESASERMFPIMTGRNGLPHPTKIPWYVADLAYSVYRSRYGDSQSLEKLAERGGFGAGEMDEFLPEWRSFCSVIDRQERIITELREYFEAIKRLVAEVQTPGNFIAIGVNEHCDQALKLIKVTR